MRRRELVAGGLAAGVAAAGGAIAYAGWNPLDDGEAVPEFELRSIEATGSADGTVVVPARGSVTFFELFATSCTVCADLMEPMGEVYDEYGEDVQFVSVTNEPLGQTTTDDDVAAWWADHGGRWTVAHDADLELTGELQAVGVPYSFVVDESNVVTWSDRGYKSADDLREPIEAALDGVGRL